MTRYKDMKDFIKMTNMVFLIETVLCICVFKNTCYEYAKSDSQFLRLFNGAFRK